MKALLSGSLALIFVFFLASPTFAASTPTFKIDQTDFLLQASAFGKPINENVLVQNLTADKQTLEVAFSGYLLPADQVLNQNYLLKHTIDFVTLPTTTFQFEPYGSIAIPINFSPPSTYPAGDYYGTLTVKNRNETNLVNFTVRILGQLKEGGEIQKIHNSGNFLIYRVANTGSFSNTFEIKTRLNWFLGRDKLFTSSKYILRSGEIREFKADLGKQTPGYFQSQNTLVYGLKNTQSTSLYSFWVNPELFIVSTVTLLISFLLYFVIKRRGS